MQEERKGSGVLVLGAACDGEQTELEAAVHADEDRRRVLEVVQGSQGPGGHEVLEEVLGGRIGGDARRDDDPGASVRTSQSPEQFGEDRICLDPTPSGEREATRSSGKVTHAVDPALLARV